MNLTALSIIAVCDGNKLVNGVLSHGGSRGGCSFHRCYNKQFSLRYTCITVVKPYVSSGVPGSSGSHLSVAKGDWVSSGTASCGEAINLYRQVSAKTKGNCNAPHGARHRSIYA